MISRPAVEVQVVSGAEAGAEARAQDTRDAEARQAVREKLDAALEELGGALPELRALRSLLPEARPGSAVWHALLFEIRPQRARVARAQAHLSDAVTLLEEWERSAADTEPPGGAPTVHGAQ